MHVAFVIDSLGSGGAQRQAVEVAVRLHRDSGARVSFAVYRDVGFFRPRLDDAGIAVHLLPKGGPLDLGFPRRLRAWVAAAMSSQSGQRLRRPNDQGEYYPPLNPRNHLFFVF